jgi:hypothetical protein
VNVSLRQRFEAEEWQAEKTLAQWIGHPALQPEIKRRHRGAEMAVEPISRLLVSQREVTRFCWHIYEMAGIYPDWSMRDDSGPWLLTFDEQNAMNLVKARFRDVVQLAVNELAGAGVDLDPNWSGDHAAVGELLLLPSFPWHLPARERAKCLNLPPVGAIHANGTGTEVRRGLSEHAESNLTAVRRSYERHLHGPPPRAPYADGGTRALPELTRRRREAVRQVLQRWPGIGASRIWTTFSDHGLQRGQIARSPGGYLRQLLEESAKDGELVTRPSKSTLYEDLKALRAASPDQELSG